MIDNSRTEADAAYFAAIAGASEHDPDGIQPPVLTPYCSVCQGAVKDYVCGPCQRDQQHEHTREESGRVVRVACSCGWRGKWRSRTAFLLEKQLNSDDGEHLSAVRRRLA